MIGKSGARQEIENYLSEIGYFIQGARNDLSDAVPNWKRRALDHIRLTLHIIDTNEDSKVESEEPDYRGGLKFTYIKRGYGEQGAQVFLNKGDAALEIRFWVSDYGKKASFTYSKDGYMTSLSFSTEGHFMYYEKED